MLRPWLLAAAVYLLVALHLLYPAWVSPAHGLVGDWTHPDMLSNHWLYAWVAERLHAGQSLLHNDRYYFPVGDAPWLAGNGSDAVPYALTLGWFAWPGSLTAWVLLTMVANGLGGMALGRAGGASLRASFAVGLAAVWCPYVSRELAAGRFAQAPLWAAAWFLAVWLRQLDRPSLAGGVHAGVAFAVASFLYWYMGLWLVLAGGLLWLARPGARPLYGFVPAALLLTAPPLALFLGRWGEVPGTAEDEFPHPIAVDNALFAGFPLWSGTGPLAGVALSGLLVGAAILGVRALPRWQRWGLGLAALLFYVLALGPELVGPDGSASGLPGPYTLAYGAASALRRFWWPYRHVAPLLLVLLPAAAQGIDRLAGALPAVPWLFAAALPLELYARGATLEVAASWWKAPEVYTKLTELPEGALVELPLARAITRTQASLLYQLVHGRVLVNGHGMWVDRVRPAAWDAWVDSQPLLGTLRTYEGGRSPNDATGSWTLAEGALRPLLDQGVRYVSVNREFFPGELTTLKRHHAKLLGALCGDPVLKGDGVRIWDLATCHGGTWTFPTWSPPSDYVDTSGRTSLPHGVASAGLRSWPRTLLPQEPQADAVSEDKQQSWAGLPAMVRRRLEREATPADTGAVAGEESPAAAPPVEGLPAEPAPAEAAPAAAPPVEGPPAGPAPAEPHR